MQNFFACWIEENRHICQHHHSQLTTASAGVPCLGHGARFTVDMVAGSRLRTPPANDLQFDGETVPASQQVNLASRSY
jgi:hypothetical protein